MIFDYVTRVKIIYIIKKRACQKYYGNLKINNALSYMYVCVRAYTYYRGAHYNNISHDNTYYL